MNIPNCFKCDKELKNLGDAVDEDINQPEGGLTFITHGHYGSTEFDSVGHGKWLEINICDECVAEKREKILLGIPLPQRFTKPVQYERWNPYKHGNG